MYVYLCLVLAIRLALYSCMAIDDFLKSELQVLGLSFFLMYVFGDVTSGSLSPL